MALGLLLRDALVAFGAGMSTTAAVAAVRTWIVTRRNERRLVGDEEVAKDEGLVGSYYELEERVKQLERRQANRDRQRQD